MKLFIILTLLAFKMFASTAFEEAYDLYKSGDFNSSLERFKTLANTEDDYDAAYILGFMYEHGEGCEINEVESQKWYKYSSRGYYWQTKPDLIREAKKGNKKLYEVLEKIDDEETQATIKQYSESLYNFKAHNANYFLPLSYRENGTYPQTNGHDSKKTEVEFQVSLRYDFAANALGLHEVYSAAYTQKSFWQFYSTSAYFRESNYNPEFFVTFPFSDKNYFKPLKAIRASVAHQSNGRGGDEERSWNYAAGSFYFQTGWLFTELKLWHRFKDAINYNPELLNYMGRGHLQFTLPYKKHIAKLLLRSNFSGKNAVELNYSHPMFGSKDLFLYVKGFAGYGESLIDYNHKVEKFGIGFSISR